MYRGNREVRKTEQGRGGGLRERLWKPAKGVKLLLLLRRREWWKNRSRACVIRVIEISLSMSIVVRRKINRTRARTHTYTRLAAHAHSYQGCGKRVHNYNLLITCMCLLTLTLIALLAQAPEIQQTKHVTSYPPWSLLRHIRLPSTTVLIVIYF